MVDVPSRGYQPIENYGIIGDLYTVALVGMDGSINFMAFPHFDSPTVFAALLDGQTAMRTIWASTPSNWGHAANTWGTFPRRLPTSP